MKYITALFILMTSAVGAQQIITGKTPVAQNINVATRAYVLWQFSAANVQVMSRTMHVARDTICSLQAVDANWYVDGTDQTLLELGTGAAMIISRAVEYPVTTIYQILYSAATSASIASGVSLASDNLSIPGCIPQGATFYMRAYYTNTSGLLYYAHASETLGDCLIFGGSVSNQTLSATVTGCNNPGLSFPPAAIVASSQRKSYCLVGSSRTYGYFDVNTSSGDLGVQARSVGSGYPYINMGIPGDKASIFVGNNTKRTALINSYCTDVGVELGVNDVQNATLLTNLGSIYGLWPTKLVHAATIDPQTSSSDNWVTAAGQTVIVDFATANTFILTKPSPVFQIWDIGAATGAAAKWRVNGTANWLTSDGTHESQSGNLFIQSSGVVAP